MEKPMFYLNDTTGTKKIREVYGTDLLTGENLDGELELSPYGVACVKEK